MSPHSRSGSSSQAGGSSADLHLRAERVFFANFAGSGDAEALELEALCAQHPELAEQLQVLHANTHRALEALSGLGPAPADGASGASPSALDLRFGADRYEIRRRIAQGGMGAILEVWDHNLHRTLAMKVLHRPELADDDSSRLRSARRRSRLLNEAEILGQLDHPAIVPVIDVGVADDGELFFTMQLVRGQAFHEVIRRVHGADPEWTLARALDVVVRTCEGVAHANSRGVLHRDLKSDNVMVGRFGEVYVMDWGLAKAEGLGGAADLRLATRAKREDAARDDSVHTARSLESDSDPLSPMITLDGDVIGTPAFMSPEQADGRIDDLGPRSEVYSLGAMLYHLLSGHPPYETHGERSPPRRVLQRVLAGPPETLSSQAPAELVAICQRAMARDPGARYGAPAEMARDLRAYLEGRVVRAHRTGALVEMRKWVGRHRGVAAAVLVSVVAVVLVAVLQSVFANELRDANTSLTSSNQELQASNAAQRRELYRKDMAIASSALDAGDVPLAQAHLLRAPASERGWEWDLLHRRIYQTDLGLVLPEAEDVSFIRWSSDGRRLAAGTFQGSLIVWSLDALDEAPYHVSVGARVMGIVFLSDGQLATVDVRNRAGIWDGLSAECQRWIEMPSHGRAETTDDGRVLRVLTDGGLGTRWDPLTGERLADPLPALNGVSAVSMGTDFTRGEGFRFEFPLQVMSDDGTRALLVHEDRTLSWLDARTGDVLARHDQPLPLFRQLEWSPDERWLAVGGVNGDVFLIELGAKSPIRLLARNASFNSWPSWSADSRNLVVRGDKLVEVHAVDEVGSAPLRLLMPAWHGGIFSPTGRWLAASARAGVQEREGVTPTLQLWDFERFDRRERVRISKLQARHVALSADEQRVAAVTLDGLLVVLDTNTGARLVETSHDVGLYSVEWLPEDAGLLVGTGDGRVLLHAAEDLELLREIPAARSRIDSMALFDEGRRFVHSTNEGFVRCLDLASGEEVWSLHESGLRMVWVDVSPDEQLVAVGDYNKGVALLLDAHSGRELRRWSLPQPCGSVIFSPDGRHLLLGMGGVAPLVSLWDLHEERFVWENVLGGGGLFSPDGTRLIGAYDHRLQVFDVETGEHVMSLDVQALGQRPFAMSRDGSLILAVSVEGYVVWWDARPWIPSKP